VNDGPSFLRLAHVHRVTTRITGTQRDLFVFDDHRAAFTLWSSAASEAGPLTLLSFDRHLDLETPSVPPPDLASPLAELDRYARESLSPRNDEQIVAALENGALADVALVARSHAPASLEAFHPYRDARDCEHRVAIARSLDDAGAELTSLVEGAERLALDIDLDCFTTLSDADPEEVVPWDREHIDGFLRPAGSENFWSAALERTRLVTIAREPYHCGGLERCARLWSEFSEVFFHRLLGVPAP
jgi:hypothetical protein